MRISAGSTKAGYASAHFYSRSDFEHICGESKSYQKELQMHFELYSSVTKHNHVDKININNFGITMYAHIDLYCHPE